MKILAVLALFALTFVGGCKTVNEIPDEKFADGIHALTYHSVYYGFKAVLGNNPGRYEQLTTDAKTASEIIRTNVLPVFTGATTGEVLRSAVDTALTQLSVATSVADTVKVALILVETQLVLPENPATELDVRTKLALAAFFSGVAEGLDQAVKDTPAPTGRTTPATPLSPTTLRWENRR